MNLLVLYLEDLLGTYMNLLISLWSELLTEDSAINYDSTCSSADLLRCLFFQFTSPQVPLLSASFFLSVLPVRSQASSCRCFFVCHPHFQLFLLSPPGMTKFSPSHSFNTSLTLCQLYHLRFPLPLWSLGL